MPEIAGVHVHVWFDPNAPKHLHRADRAVWNVNLEHCRANVASNYRFVTFHQCLNRGKIEEGGYLWCGTHAPSRVAERQRRATERYDAKWAARIKVGPLIPSAGLLAKLGSVVVHAGELFSSGGHAFDRAALNNLVTDPEVEEWLAQMRKLALIPEKRNSS